MCVCVCADSRQHGRGGYGAPGRGDPARGHNRSRLLPLQHKAPDGTLSYRNPLSAKEGRKERMNKRNAGIRIAIEAETERTKRSRGRNKITAPAGVKLTLYNFTPSSRPLASPRDGVRPRTLTYKNEYTRTHANTYTLFLPRPFFLTYTHALFLSLLFRSFSTLSTILIFVRK